MRVKLSARLRLARIRWKQKSCPHVHVTCRRWLGNRDRSPYMMTRYICEDCGSHGPFYPINLTPTHDVYRWLELARELPVGTKREWLTD